MNAPAFDFKNPDYVSVYRRRAARLAQLRADPGLMAAVRVHYRNSPSDFISDWGMTVDPRNIERGLPANLPFVLFDRQREWIDYVVRKWRAGEDGLTEKSRDVGVTWLAAALACTMSLHHEGFTVGFGSRKEEYVDKLGTPKCIFYKIRMFMTNLPTEFRGGWQRSNAPHMRCEFPNTGSIITGEAGDNIGRGDRASIYFVDEAAHLERPQLVDASLSNTTNCRQDLSSVNGSANPFAEKANGGKIEKFTFHWRDDPRKDDAWYAKMVEKLDPVVVAQEIDINYTASVEGIVIPALWVQAAIGAAQKLGIVPTGTQEASLDVADRGIDKNALAWRHGVVLQGVRSWSGKTTDIYDTTEKAFQLCDELGLRGFRYDGDGLGAGVRGDARKLNELRGGRNQPKRLSVVAFRGSAGVHSPEQIVPRTDRKAIDFFANYKAQSWWALRFRFEQTYRAVIQGAEYKRDDIISIDPDFKERARLVTELSQPVYLINNAGKILIDKQPDGVASPNLADAVMMLFAPITPAFNISPEALRLAAGVHR